MFTRAISYFSSLVVSLAMLAGSVLNGTPVQSQTQPQPPTPTQPAPTQAAPKQRTPLLKRLALMNWPYKGDPQVRQGLVLATVSVTGLHPVDVWNGLADGKSLADLANSKGKTAEDILAVFDESV